MAVESKQTKQKVLIVGGGVTGLATAYRLATLRPDLEIRLVEAESRLGGNIRTESERGFIIDGGPDSFITTKPEVVQLSRELGIQADLITVTARCQGLEIVRSGKLLELPEGMALGIPTRLLPVLKTPLLSLVGRARALLEPFIPPAPDGTPETLAEFFRRRVGRELTERIAGPLLSGIFAGEAEELSMAATFPQLAALERRFGSLAFGAYAMHRASAQSPTKPLWQGLPQSLRALHMLPWALRRREPSPSPFASFRHGMRQLIDAIVKASPTVAFAVATEVTNIERNGEHWIAELKTAKDNETWQGDALVIACPTERAARFVADAELASLLNATHRVNTASIVFGFRRDAVAHSLSGLGVVVPAGEGRVSAITFSSSKWTGRAPPGHVLLRTYLGGARDPELVRSSNDQQLVDIALGELRRLLGRCDDPVLAKVFRFTRPQPTDIARPRAIRSRARALGQLYVVGGGLDGIGIPDCIRQAETAARDIAEGLPRR